MSKNNQRRGGPGRNKQGILTLDHIKGKSVGRKVDLAFLNPNACEHPIQNMRDVDGVATCTCGAMFDLDGRAI